MSDIKLAVIGGGSSYTPELISGIIDRIELLPIREIVLVDIPEGEEKLSIIHALSERMMKKRGINCKITKTFDRKSALNGASFVINQFRVGGLKARELDESIPLELGIIGQETTGPGGFAKACRTIPVALNIAGEMESYCPNAWLINFTNPAGMITQAITHYSNIRCIGLCNVPISMEMELAKILERDYGSFQCDFVGLNHLSWITGIWIDGVNRIDEVIEKIISEGEEKTQGLLPFPESKELITAIRAIPSSYLNYYYFERYMLEKQKEDYKQGKGVRAQQVMKIEEELFNIYAQPDLDEKPPQLSQRGGAFYSEVALSLIDSIYRNTGKMHVVNTVNRGAITDLEENDVIEINCLVDSRGAKPLASGKLPPAISSLVRQVKTYERFTIEAAVEGSREKAFLALLNHPIVHGANTAKMLLERLFEAHRPYLQQFFTGRG